MNGDVRQPDPEPANSTGSATSAARAPHRLGATLSRLTLAIVLSAAVYGLAVLGVGVARAVPSAGPIPSLSPPPADLFASVGREGRLSLPVVRSGEMRIDASSIAPLADSAADRRGGLTTEEHVRK